MYNPNRYDNRTFLLYIDDCGQGDLSGRFINPCTGDAGTFQCMSQLIMRIDSCLDLNDAPQAFHTVRRFAPHPRVCHIRPEEASSDPGRVASFSLHILFRRNASWQGTVTWLEQRQTQRFRSALELMMLISSAAESLRSNNRLLHFGDLSIALEG